MKPSSKIAAFIALIAALRLPLPFMDVRGCEPTQEDRDGDCIPDALETKLLQRFAPVIYTDGPAPVPREGVGVPVSVSWLLRHSSILYARFGNTAFPKVVIVNPTVREAITAVSSQDDPTNLFIRNDYRFGDAPGDNASWPSAAQNGDGIYGRVWRPWQGYPELYSIQYFLILTWNETAYGDDNGNHEGDWICVDYAVDVRCSKDNPPVLHAIYHNHGRQLFLTPESILFENGHPVVFLEGGTNEAWPNSGDRGFGGWPRQDGFASNTNFDYDEVAEWYEELFAELFGGINEHKIVREHTGRGNRYAPHEIPRFQIPNVGDFDPNDKPISLCGEEGEFILKFSGRWGLVAVEAKNPEGPRHQGKLWSRDWNRDATASGPWTISQGPFGNGGARATVVYSSNMPPQLNCEGCPVGFHLWTTPGHFFTVPALRNLTYVNFNAAQEGNGSAVLPYRNLLLGIAMTVTGGTVVMQPGSFQLHLEIKQPVTLTTSGGVITIGQ